MIHFITLSLFPKIFETPLDYSIIKRAKESKLVRFSHYDIRDFTKDKHKRVDDIIYGGGAGMLMTPQPIFDAIEYIKKFEGDAEVIFFTPKGDKLNSKIVQKYASTDIPKFEKRYILLCGRYEGIDNRVREILVDHEISIGDFILSGGEFAALIFMDSVIRYLDGALGNKESLEEESFNNNLLEYPQYTRPANFRGMEVPKVLLSGHHKKIKEWRLEKQIEITKRVRKELLE